MFDFSMKVAIMDRLIGELTAIESALAALQQQASLALHYSVDREHTLLLMKLTKYV